MNKNKTYTIIIYSENSLGLLNRMTAIFNRRHTNIESINVSHSEIEGVSRHTIVIISEENWVKKIVAQIEKQIEVISAFYYTNSQTIFQEMALIKMAHQNDEAKSVEVESIIRDSNATIISVNPTYFVIEKTGHRTETMGLYNALKPYGVKQFVRSGRVSVTRTEMPVSKKLEKFKIKK